MDTYKSPNKSTLSLTIGNKTLEVDITGCDVEWDGKRLKVSAAEPAPQKTIRFVPKQTVNLGLQSRSLL